MTRIEPVGGGWTGRDRGSDMRWRMPFPGPVAKEVAGWAREASAGAADRRSLTALHATQGFAVEIAARLAEPGGFVVVSGFPLDDLDDNQIQLAFMALAVNLGSPVSQNLAGDFMVCVRDRGAEIANPHHRGHESDAALPFHGDRTDLIGLLCLRSARSGGVSRLVSSRTLHDMLLQESPELLRELYLPLPHDRRGEQNHGEAPWCEIPVFSVVKDSFAARYVQRFITGSQRHEGAPRLTPRQLEALAAMEELLERPEVSLEMTLWPGDVQLLNNFELLHARTAFADLPGAPGRLLFRVWLAWAASPMLPASYTPLFGATMAGSYRGGVWPRHARPPRVGKQVEQPGTIASLPADLDLVCGAPDVMRERS